MSTKADNMLTPNNDLVIKKDFAKLGSKFLPQIAVRKQKSKCPRLANACVRFPGFTSKFTVGMASCRMDVMDES